MRLLVVLFFLTAVKAVFAQDNAVDSLPPHSVKKAVILSAVIPGAGQIYNHLAMPRGKKKAYWKVPLIYAGLASTGYFMIKNNSIKNDLRREYYHRKDGNAPAKYTDYDMLGLTTLYAEHRSRRDLLMFGFGLIYILNVVDAGVEAHFTHFDIGDDLTLSISPAILPSYKLGMGVQLNFR